MLEVASLIVAVGHGLILIVHVIGVLHLCPHKVLREVFPDLDNLSVLVRNTQRVVHLLAAVELEGVRDFAKMPAGAVSECAASSLRSLATGLHFPSSGLAGCCCGSFLCIKPQSGKGGCSVGIGYHRRVQLAILTQEENLIARSGLGRRFCLADAETFLVGYVQVLIAEDYGTLTIGTAIIGHSNEPGLVENLRYLLTGSICVAQSILQSPPNLKTSILLALNDVGKGLESLREPVRAMQSAVEFLRGNLANNGSNPSATFLGERFHFVYVVVSGVLGDVYRVKIPGSFQ